ncbi:MAG: Histone acetyltransferase complex subunit [Trizodia sp. TS-e1964]|nr:MAG: Histone acetyltransferase complex subunit [Trizodia sp. TS-e1964]
MVSANGLWLPNHELPLLLSYEDVHEWTDPLTGEYAWDQRGLPPPTFVENYPESTDYGPSSSESAESEVDVEAFEGIQLEGQESGDDDNQSESSNNATEATAELASQEENGGNGNCNDNSESHKGYNGDEVDIKKDDAEQHKETFCICKSSVIDGMIQCSHALCENKWFHPGCVGINVPPKKTWFCPKCLKVVRAYLAEVDRFRKRPTAQGQDSEYDQYAQTRSKRQKIGRTRREMPAPQESSNDPERSDVEPRQAGKTLQRPRTEGKTLPRPTTGGKTLPRPATGGKTRPRPTTGRKTLPMPQMGGKAPGAGCNAGLTPSGLPAPGSEFDSESPSPEQSEAEEVARGLAEGKKAWLKWEKRIVRRECAVWEARHITGVQMWEGISATLGIAGYNRTTFAVKSWLQKQRKRQADRAAAFGDQLLPRGGRQAHGGRRKARRQ